MLSLIIFKCIREVFLHENTLPTSHACRGRLCPVNSTGLSIPSCGEPTMTLHPRILSPGWQWFPPFSSFLASLSIYWNMEILHGEPSITACIYQLENTNLGLPKQKNERPGGAVRHSNTTRIPATFFICLNQLTYGVNHTPNNTMYWLDQR